MDMFWKAIKVCIVLLILLSPSLVHAADIKEIRSKLHDHAINEDRKRHEQSKEASPSAQPSQFSISLPERRAATAVDEKPDTIVSLDVSKAKDSDVDLVLQKMQDLKNDGKEVTYVDGGKVPAVFFFAYNSKDKLDDLKEQFKDSGALKVAENRVYKSQFTPNDPLYPSQTNLPLIDYSGGLDIGGGTARPVIAIMDNGVNVDEADINPNMHVKSTDTYGDGIDNDSNGFVDDTYGCDFYKYNRSGGASSCLKASLFDSSCTNINSSCNHGLWTAEIAAAYTNNNFGMASICPICKIMALRVDDTGGAFISDIISGLNYAMNEGVNIINFSYTSTCPFDASGDVLNPYIDSAVNTYKINYVQAAGNQGSMTQSTCTASCGSNPYCSSSARNQAYYYIDGKAVANKFIVAATDNNHGRASFSDFDGTTNQQITIAAPGQNIPVAINGSSTTVSGTSFSAPQVAGAIGLALSYLLPKYTPSPAEMVEIINNTGRPISTDQNISGRELYLSKVMQLAASRATVYGTSYVFVSRFSSPVYQSHYYTGSDRAAVDLRANPGSSQWFYEGTAFYAFGSQVANTVPVYEFYSAKLNTYFYTANYDEKNQILATYPDNVWHLDGVMWYTYPLAYTGPSTTVFRFWSPSLGRHFYTSSTAERDNLIATQNVYQYEGPVWKNP